MEVVVLEKLRPYSKSILAAVGAAVVTLQAALSDGGVSTDEWGAVVVAVLVALGVYQVRNSPTPP